MAEEAKEVRDRLKANLGRAQVEAAALGDGPSPALPSAPPGAPRSAVAVAGAVIGAAVAGEDGMPPPSAGVSVAGGGGGGGGGGGVSSSSAGVGGGDVLRRALMEVDRVTGQLGRASTAVDLACYLRDAALSFLQE